MSATDAHGHDDHAHHHHGIAADADRGKLAIALALIVGFMAVEIVVGLLASSIALLSDAGHMLTDAAAIALALGAIALGRRPAEGPYTFGLRRAEILSAQINGATLLVLGVLFLVEGARHVASPPNVDGGAVLGVALVGIAVNLAATLTLARANRASLNIEGAYQHLLTDLAAFIATAVAGLVILTTGFHQADGLAAIFVALIMLRAAWVLLRESGRIFLEAAPRGMDVEEIGLALAGVGGVVEVHDLHVWEVSSGFPALSAHVVVARHRDCHERRRDLERLLADQFDIRHTTLQMDHVGDELVQIEANVGL